MSSRVNVTSGSGFDRSGRITSGRVRGSTTTLAMRVFDQRSYVAVWHLRQLCEPTYVRSPDAGCVACGDVAAASRVAVARDSEPANTTAAATISRVERMSMTAIVVRSTGAALLVRLNLIEQRLHVLDDRIAHRR